MYLLEDGTQRNIWYVLLFFRYSALQSSHFTQWVFSFLNQGPASSLCMDCVAQVRDIPDPTPLSPAAGSKAGSVPGSVQEGGAARERAGRTSNAPPPGDRPPPTENKPPLSDTATGGNNLPPSVGHSADSTPGESGLRTPSKPTATGFNMAASDSKGAVGQVPGTNASSIRGTDATVEDAELKFVDVAVNEDGTYQSYVSFCVCACVGV